MALAPLALNSSTSSLAQPCYQQDPPSSQVVAMLPDLTLVPPIPHPLPERINLHPICKDSGLSLLLFLPSKPIGHSSCLSSPVSLLPRLLAPHLSYAQSAIDGATVILIAFCPLDMHTLQEMESYIVRHTPCSSHTQLRF